MITLEAHFNYDKPMNYEMTANCSGNLSSYLNTKHVSQLTKENRILLHSM